MKSFDKIINEKARYWLYIDQKNPVTTRKVTVATNDVTLQLGVGDFVVIEDNSIKYLGQVLVEKAYSPYQQSGLTGMFTLDIPIPPGHFEMVQLYEVEYWGLVEGDKVGNPGRLRPSPSATWRLAQAAEIQDALNKHGNGFATVLGHTNSTPVKATDEKIVPLIIDPEHIFKVVLLAGQQGSGKTNDLGYYTWYYTQRYQDAFTGGVASVILLNNKDDDLLYLDNIPDYKDPLWAELDLEPSAIRDFQIIVPSIGRTLRPGIRPLKYTFNTMQIVPEILLGIMDFTEKAELQLPLIFRYWQEEVGGPSDRLEHFIQYLREQSRGQTFTLLGARNGRTFDLTCWTSTVTSIISNLTSAIPYFDDPNARMISIEELVEPGRCTVIDVVHADPKFSNLVVRQLMQEALRYQQNESGDKNPILFGVDEAHKIFPKTNILDASVAKEIENLVRLGRSLRIGTILASQRASHLSKDVVELSQTRIVHKTTGTEFSKLEIPKKFQESIKFLDPGYAILQTARFKRPMIIKMPRSPVRVG